MKVWILAALTTLSMSATAGTITIKNQGRVIVTAAYNAIYSDFDGCNHVSYDLVAATSSEWINGELSTYVKIDYVGTQTLMMCIWQGIPSEPKPHSLSAFTGGLDSNVTPVVIDAPDFVLLSIQPDYILEPHQ